MSTSFYKEFEDKKILQKIVRRKFWKASCSCAEVLLKGVGANLHFIVEFPSHVHQRRG